MKTLVLILGAALVLPAVASDAPATASADIAFAGALEACTVASHQGPHPFVKGFTIEHAITGEKDGVCSYSQTMPGEMRLECALSMDGRKGLAGQFREQAEGRLKGSTASQPGWARECEIVTRDGKRTPMAGG